MSELELLRSATREDERMVAAVDVTDSNLVYIRDSQAFVKALQTFVSLKRAASRS